VVVKSDKSDVVMVVATLRCATHVWMRMKKCIEIKILNKCP
jgi:hypothetical protein